jgi:anti-sigma factor ChrR (cupin superfamily)
MTDHSRSADDCQTLAALHALGTLDTRETAALLRSAVPEVRDFERVVQALGYAATPVEAPPSLRGRFLERLRQPAAVTPAPPVSTPTSPGPQAEQPFFLRAHEGAWKPGPFVGTTMRMLFVDTARQYATLLLRIAPGEQLDPHVHVDAEEAYVLEGACRFDTHTFGVGDYIRMPAGTRHNAVTSEAGCLLLIVASTQVAPG